MQISIHLTDDDVKMMKAIETFIQKNNVTPKKREVVTRDCLDRDFKGSRAGRVFERLKLLDIVEHSLNGHCWLTPQGKQAMRVRYPVSTIIENLTTHISCIDKSDDNTFITHHISAYGFAEGLLIASALTDDLYKEVLEVIDLAADRGLNKVDPEFSEKRRLAPHQWPAIQKRLQNIDDLLREIHTEEPDAKNASGSHIH